MSNSYYEGVVTFWHKTKWYGFIRYEDNGETKEIFTHSSYLDGLGRLKEGMKVKFRIGITERGFVAEDVKRG
jgi:cold shock CspA family protein